MALEIEFINVIVRKAAIEKKFPGGLEAYAAQDLVNYSEDKHLTRVGFMSTTRAHNFIEELQQYGLTFIKGIESDIGIVTRNSHPSWITKGMYQGTFACWLKATLPGEVIKSKTGFLLRCPVQLYQTIERVAALCNAEIRRKAPSETDDEAILSILHCSRGNAYLRIDVIGYQNSDKPVALWAQRDFSRRQYYKIDIQLAEDLEAELLKHGATGK